MSVDFSANHSKPASSYSVYWDTDAGMLGSSNSVVYEVGAESVFDSATLSHDINSTWMLSINDSLIATTVYFGAKAFNRFGASPMSVLTSVLLTVPDTVTGLTATKDSGDTQIEVQWDTLSGATAYQLYYSTTSPVTLGDNYETVYGSSHDLHSTTNEYVAIRAQNHVGFGPLSDTVQAGSAPISPSGSTWTDPNFSIEMVKISSGTFTMGSPNTETGHNTNEGPQHQVTISKDFYLGKYEVTQGQWEAVIDSASPWPDTTPSSTYGLSTSHPAYYVGWSDINEVDGFLDKLNAAAGCDTSVLPTDTSTRYHPDNVPSGCYRLPTEAEWEYSARAGTTTRFSHGDDEGYSQLTNYAWYYDNSQNKTHAVGQKISNPWGLYDTYGNLWEWTYDWYGSYSSNSQIDPSGPSTGSLRVVRGGTWGKAAHSDAPGSAYRGRLSRFNRYETVGFRLLLVK